MRYNVQMNVHQRPLPRYDGTLRKLLRHARPIVGSLLLALSACTANSPDAAYDRYLSRLARTLSVPKAEAAPLPLVPLPAPRSLHLDIAPGKLGALDFLALSGCAVQVTIGKRNSSLGLMARDSQRLLLDLEYLRLAPACIAWQRERGDEALATALEQAWATKRRELPALIFNATLAGSEFREFWKASIDTADYPANTGSTLITSLAAVNDHVRRWLAGDYRADNRTFELLLAEVAKGDGGALRRALAAQAGALAAADRMLRQRQQRGPLCAPGFRPEAADILANVVRKYFIAGIQPRAAAINRRYHELLRPVAELEALLEIALPPAYRSWRQQRDERLATMTRAPRQHVERLQAIQQPCGTNPQAIPRLAKNLRQGLQ